MPVTEEKIVRATVAVPAAVVRGDGVDVPRRGLVRRAKRHQRSIAAHKVNRQRDDESHKGAAAEDGDDVLVGHCDCCVATGSSRDHVGVLVPRTLLSNGRVVVVGTTRWIGDGRVQSFETGFLPESPGPSYN